MRYNQLTAGLNKGRNEGGQYWRRYPYLLLSELVIAKSLQLILDGNGSRDRRYEKREGGPPMSVSMFKRNIDVPCSTLCARGRQEYWECMQGCGIVTGLVQPASSSAPRFSRTIVATFHHSPTRRRRSGAVSRRPGEWQCAKGKGSPCLPCCGPEAELAQHPRDR